MTSLRFIIAISIIVMSPVLVWAQASIEAIPSVETSSTIFQPTLFSNIFTYIVLFSLGAIVFASGIWYKVYHKRPQHPYLFLERAEASAAQAEEEGDIKKAIEILTHALQTIENDPKNYSKTCKSRQETIWFIKRKLQELDEILLEIND